MPGATAVAVARHSISAGLWTTVSRLTGFIRVAAVAAVLGPTYFGNTYQATNLLPNITYQFLTGSVLVPLLVPPLVRHVEGRDVRAAERLAGGFLGVALIGFTIATITAIIAAPAILALFSFGVDNPELARAQARTGILLMAMLMPQVVLYGIASTGAAVMNAHGRFALAAAAPAMENLGILVTMGVAAVVFGTGVELPDVSRNYLLLLGLGTTGSVALHAGAQCWGARRVGVRLVPRAGWRDPEVREIGRRIIPSLGSAGLSALRVFLVLVVANRISGGVVAFQLALAFFHLPTAVWARPVAVAMLPALARAYQRKALDVFHAELVRGLALAALLIVPAAAFYVALAEPISKAVAFGEMATPAAITLVSASLAALAAGVVGEAAFVVATHASYAREDAGGPFRAMAVSTAVMLSGVALASTATTGTALLVTLGLTIALSDLVSAAYLGLRLQTALPRSAERLYPPLLRAFIAAAVMLVPAVAVSAVVPDLVADRPGRIAGVALAAVVAVGTFFGAQLAFRSPELRSLRAAISGIRPGVRP